MTISGRRNFFKSIAGATAGMYVMARGGSADAQAPVARRQVSIGGRRIRVVDVHAHCNMPLGDVVAGTPFENRADANTRLEERLLDMDENGLDIQALSINGFWWYEATDRGLARAICNSQNEQLAAWVRDHSDRFVAMASVPLQFPDLAAEVLEDAVTRLGARGVTLGGHVNGEDLSLPKFDPFWAKAADMGELVFMHPGGADNIIRDGAFQGRGALGNIMGNPLETTLLPFSPDLRRRLRPASGATRLRRARGWLSTFILRPDRGGLRRARQRQLRQHEAADGVSAIADSRRYDGLL